MVLSYGVSYYFIIKNEFLVNKYILYLEMYSYCESAPYSKDIPDSKLLQALESGKRLHCPDDCPLQVYQLMLSCWNSDSHLRPTFTQLKHLIEEINQ
jgi:hypothetical protein